MRAFATRPWAVLSATPLNSAIVAEGFASPCAVSSRAGAKGEPRRPDRGLRQLCGGTEDAAVELLQEVGRVTPGLDRAGLA